MIIEAMICDFKSLVLNLVCVSFILLTGLLIIGIVCLIGLYQPIGSIVINFKKTINIGNIRMLYMIFEGKLKEVKVVVTAVRVFTIIVYFITLY